MDMDVVSRDQTNRAWQSPGFLDTFLTHGAMRINQQGHFAHTAEIVWLALVENPDAPLEHSLAFHIADALAVRSRKRILLIDISEQGAVLAAHFAMYSDQLRPSLLECACDHNSLRKHQAPTVTIDGWHYPAIAALLPMSSVRGTLGFSEPGGFDIHSTIIDLAGFYDYLLLVTTYTTAPTLIEMVAGTCSSGVVLISSDTVGRERGQAGHLSLLSGLFESPSAPYSIFVAHVPEQPTIGAQDRYTRRLGHRVTRLLPADTSLLERSWKRRIALNEAASQADLTRAVDFVARYIAHQTVGIAFGGGGARGFAHLGALERLLHYGIPVDYVAGCSIGALLSALYLMGRSFAESQELFLDIQRHIMRWSLPRTSFFSNKILMREIRKQCGDLRFEDLSTPFAMVAIDLATRVEVTLDRGPLWLAALASVSIPGIFPPVAIGKHMLIDAGIADPVPTRAARKMGADILLALDLEDCEPLTLQSATPWLEEAGYALSKRPFSPHIVNVLMRAYEAGKAAISMHSNSEADVVIRPKTYGVSLLQFAKGTHLVASGHEAVEQSLPALQEWFPWL